MEDWNGRLTANQYFTTSVKIGIPYSTHMLLFFILTICEWEVTHGVSKEKGDTILCTLCTGVELYDR